MNLKALDHAELLDKSVNNLLDDFGAGHSAPGSGSAAALMGILSGKLILTVCKLSLQKAQEERRDIDAGLVKKSDLRYIPIEDRLNYIVDDITNNIEPNLKKLFADDSKEFEQVVELRKKRNRAKASGNKEFESKFNIESLDKLQLVTGYVFTVADECFKLIKHGNYIFDNAYNAVRGDSGASISAAIAGITTSIFIINLNLVSLSRRNWSKTKKLECDELYELLQKTQLDAFTRVGALSAEVMDTMQLNLEQF